MKLNKQTIDKSHPSLWTVHNWLVVWWDKIVRSLNCYLCSVFVCQFSCVKPRNRWCIYSHLCEAKLGDVLWHFEISALAYDLYVPPPSSMKMSSPPYIGHSKVPCLSNSEKRVPMWWTSFWEWLMQRCFWLHRRASCSPSPILIYLWRVNRCRWEEKNWLLRSVRLNASLRH